MYIHISNDSKIFKKFLKIDGHLDNKGRLRFIYLALSQLLNFMQKAGSIFHMKILRIKKLRDTVTEN